MTLQGTLDAFAIPDIFQLLSFSHKTGALHLRGPSTGLVYFHNGEVYFASAKTDDNLGTALVRSGVVEDAAWKAAITEARGKRPVGEVLVQEKGVDSDRLEAFLRERVEEAVFDLLRWEKGRFDFRQDEAHALGPIFTFPSEPLLSEGRRRIEEWEVITQSIPSVRVSVEMVRALPEEHREVTLTRDEWRILSGVDGRRSVQEIARLLGEGDFHTCQVLHGLVSTGLVGVLQRPAGEAEPVPEISEEEGFDEHFLEEEEEGEAPSEPAVEAEEVTVEAAGEATLEQVAAEAASVAEVEPEVAEVEPEVAEVAPEVAEVAPVEAVPEPTPPVAMDDNLEGLSLAAAVAALEGAPEGDVSSPSVLGALSDLDEDEQPSEEKDLGVSVSSDLFADLDTGDLSAEAPPAAETKAPSATATLDQDLLSDVLSTPMPEAPEPEAAPETAAPAARLASASVAREFGQLAATTGRREPAPTEGAHALEAKKAEEPSEPEKEAPPTPKSAGLNKTLILRLISGVKDL